MANLQLFAKLGLALLIVISIAILFERLTDVRYYWFEDDLNIEVKTENSSIDSITQGPDIEKYTFAKKFSDCLIEFSRSRYYPMNETKSKCVPNSKCMWNLLFSTINIMERLNIKLLLIEPSLLFCLLPTTSKFNLLTRGFDHFTMKGYKNVMAFGILESDAEKLDKASTRIEAEFKLLKFSSSTELYDFDTDDLDVAVMNSHYFIMHSNMMIHLIVFRDKGSYVWFPALNATESRLETLHYTNDSAFEKFNTSLVYLEDVWRTKLNIPYDTRSFLLDMMSSNFIECKAMPLHKVISKENDTVIMALKELKKVLQSQMITFWLWSHSLRGWHEKCDILHYSEELEFAVAAKSVTDNRFTGLPLFTSKCLLIESHINLDSSTRNIKLNCSGVSINLIFIYEEGSTYWYDDPNEQNSLRVMFPKLKFKLCSTDVFEQKINVPCEAGAFLNHGQFLNNTTLVTFSNITFNVMH